MSFSVRPIAVVCLVASLLGVGAGEARAQGKKPGKGNDIQFGAISPNRGPLAGGTKVTITGKHLKGISKVTIGGVALTGLALNGNETEVTGTTGAGLAAGPVDVVLYGSADTHTQPKAFTYDAPPGMTFASITPTSGPVTGGTPVTIAGTNFKNVTSVTIGGSALAGVVVDPTFTKITGTTAARNAAGPSDLVIVSSTLGTLTKTGAFNYTNVPQLLAIVSGNNQTGTVGSTLPNGLVVKVTGAGGSPIAGVSVTFAVASGGGTLSATSVATDALGQAATRLTLGAAPAANTVTATVTGLTPVTFTATGTAATPGSLAIVSGNNQTGLVGANLAAPFVVAVKDATGAPLAGVTVAFAVGSGGGTLSATSVATNAQGQASSTLKLGPAPATNTVTATVTGLTPVTFTATGTAAPPASIAVVSGNNQSGPAGSALPLPLVVVVKDGSGAAVANVAVTFAVTAGAGTLSASSVPTNAQGQAQTSLTLGAAPGTNMVSASVAGVTAPAVFTATGNVVVVLTYFKDVQPIMQASCVSCHGPGGVMATRPLTTFAEVVNTLSTIYTPAKYVTPGQPLQSLLHLKMNGVSTVGGVMPPTGALPAATLQVVKTWIEQGAQQGTAATPASVAKVSGDTQTGVSGSALGAPFVVIVKDSAGAALANVNVAFAVTGGGGSLSATNVMTNAQGQASATLTLGRTAGTNTVTATVTGLTALGFTATGTAGPASALAIVSGNNQTGVAGSTLPNPLAVSVKDANGNAVSNVTITFAIAAGGGTVTPLTMATNAQGQAQTSLRLGPLAGANTVTASGTGLTAVTFTASATSAPATQLVLTSGNTQTGVAGSALTNPFVVTARDANNNPVQGVMVTFAVTAGGGTLSATSAATNAQGQASATLTLGRTAGTNTVTATATGLTAVTFSATGTAGPATVLAIASGNNQTALAGSTLANPLVVAVRDANNNPVANVTITFAVTAGGGTLTPLTMATNAQGQASTSLRLGNAAGANTVTASATGLTTVTFSASGTAAPATQLVIASGNNQTGVAGTTLANPLVVTARDASGNPVANVTITFAVTAGGGTVTPASMATNAQGQASTALRLGATPSSNTVTASATGLTAVTFTATGTPPPPASIAIVSGNNQKARIGMSCAAPLVVVVKDASGANLAGVNVTFAVTAGGGSVTPASMATNAQGQASTTLRVGKTLGANTVTATVAGLTPVSFSATAEPLTYVDDVRPIMTAKCIVCHGPGGVLASKPWTTYNEIRYGVSFGGQPIITPFVPTASVFIQKTQPGGTMANNLTATEAQVLLDWVLTGAVQDNLGTLPASQLTITSGNNQSAPAGSPLPNPLVVTATDANNRGVSGVAITWTVTAGGGTLSSIVATTDVNGVASARLTLGAAGGANTVTAAAPGLTTATFTATGVLGYSGAPLTGSTNPLDVAALVALRANNIEPVRLSTDGEFLRRVTTVLLGRLPTNAELDAFLANASATKRATTIDSLLASAEFATHWSVNIFGPWTQTTPTVSFTDANNVTTTYQYDTSITTHLLNDTPLSTIVRNLATGANQEGMAFLQAHNGNGGNDMADQLMMTFTGMTSKCARCHDHPISTTADDPRWVQDDNYGLYAFFATSTGAATKLDRTGRRFGTPVQPRWVADGYASAPTGLPLLTDALATRRARFADLLVASNAFARGTAHRIWSEIATPLLDENQFLKANLDAVRSPALLTALRDEFKRTNTSLKAFLRTCLNSRLFQLTSAGTTTAADPFQGRYVLRRQHSETVQSGVASVTGVAFNNNDVFRFSFGYPVNRELITERKDDPTTDQALLQMNSSISTQGRVTQSTSRAATLATSVDGGTMTYAQAATQLVRAALHRDPTAAELTAIQTARTASPTTRAALEDLIVALTATTEFMHR